MDNTLDSLFATGKDLGKRLMDDELNEGVLSSFYEEFGNVISKFKTKKQIDAISKSFTEEALILGSPESDAVSFTDLRMSAWISDDPTAVADVDAAFYQTVEKYRESNGDTDAEHFRLLCEYANAGAVLGAEFANAKKGNNLQFAESVQKKALDMGCFSVKTNTVMLAGINDSELPDIAAMACNDSLMVRFIEVMPIGEGARTPGPDREAVLHILKERWPDLHPVEEIRGNGPAHYYAAEGLTGRIGLIDAVSHKFCERCNRVRLTSSGFLKLCLHYNNGIELWPLLRGGVSDSQLTETLREAIYNKPLHHSFDGVKPEGEDDQLELKNMSQIGG